MALAIGQGLFGLGFALGLGLGFGFGLAWFGVRIRVPVMIMVGVKVRDMLNRSTGDRTRVIRDTYPGRAGAMGHMGWSIG